MRRYAHGPEFLDGEGVSFRVWAPDHARIQLVLDDKAMALDAEGEGYFSGETRARPGARYGFRPGSGSDVLPDPASRRQPDGPAGLSQLVAPATASRRTPWVLPDLRSAVIYELHIGTFTQEGTWRAAIERLGFLKALGVGLLEVMPSASFEGGFGWGYDVALPYAPYEPYGSPEDMRAFVDAAHALGLGVLLDVVYNHVGFGATLERFSRRYFAAESTDWGQGINFDGVMSAGVRAYFRDNARYWIEEFGFDGLRFDAVQAIKDRSSRHILTEIIETCRAEAGRPLLFIGENEPQRGEMLRPPAQGGLGVDATWNDDFHHAALAALTGRSEAYYHDTPGAPQELVAALRHGYLFQGQRYDWQDNPRGTPVLELDASQFVHFLENHDQIANSGLGQRLHQKTSGGRLRAATALLLLGRQVPMLFQGQEFLSSAPFLYFLDQQGELGAAVRAGRREELSQFPSLADPDLDLPDPSAWHSFARSKLDWSEAATHAGAVRLHRDLIALRHSQPALRRAHSSRAPTLDASVIGPEALLVRFFGERAGDDLLLLCNLGRDLRLPSIPDPMAAPPEGCDWTVIWASEDQRYGGDGQAPVDLLSAFTLGGASAVLLAVASR